MKLNINSISSIFLIFLSLFTSSIFAKEIVFLQADEAKDKYHIDLIKFLYKDDPNYSLRPYRGEISYGRQKSEIEAGNLTVAAFATDKKIEQQLQPIRIPILKGLLGHRIFIIRDGEQSKFANINSFSDLLRYKAGQGRTWADTAVLETSGLNTITAVKYHNLFLMLEGGRFDFFPRGVHEPFSEVATRPELNLVVEPKLMMVYPLALYLFVAKDNQELAKDMTMKLEKSIDSGEFDEFFYSHPLIIDVLKKVNIKQRRVFRVDNPHMSAATPLDEPKYWLNIEDIPDI